MSLQSCPTLCNSTDSSPPDSPVPGILQARTLEWVAISFSNAWKWKVKVKLLSRVQLLATPWTEAYQAPPSMGFSRQEYWSGLPLPSPRLELDTCKFLFHTSLFIQSCLFYNTSSCIFFKMKRISVRYWLLLSVGSQRVGHHWVTEKQQWYITLLPFFVVTSVWESSNTERQQHVG